MQLCGKRSRGMKNFCKARAHQGVQKSFFKSSTEKQPPLMARYLCVARTASPHCTVRGFCRVGNIAENMIRLNKASPPLHAKVSAASLTPWLPGRHVGLRNRVAPQRDPWDAAGVGSHTSEGCLPPPLLLCRLSFCPVKPK